MILLIVRPGDAVTASALEELRSDIAHAVIPPDIRVIEERRRAPRRLGRELPRAREERRGERRGTVARPFSGALILW